MQLARATLSAAGPRRPPILSARIVDKHELLHVLCQGFQVEMNDSGIFSIVCNTKFIERKGTNRQKFFERAVAIERDNKA
jgi:hypothetical protein